MPQHPDRECITRRYLRKLAELVNPTLERLLDGDVPDARPPGKASRLGREHC